MKFLGHVGRAPVVKVATALAIAATAAVVAAEAAITISTNRASSDHRANQQPAFAPDNGRPASASQAERHLTTPGESTIAAGGADAQSNVKSNDTTQDTQRASRPTTPWFTEPNDPPMVAVQTKFIPKP